MIFTDTLDIRVDGNDKATRSKSKKQPEHKVGDHIDTPSEVPSHYPQVAHRLSHSNCLSKSEKEHYCRQNIFLSKTELQCKSDKVDFCQ